jgi:hypothetical protein
MIIRIYYYIYVIFSRVLPTRGKDVSPDVNFNDLHTVRVCQREITPCDHSQTIRKMGRNMARLYEIRGRQLPDPAHVEYT